MAVTNRIFMATPNQTINYGTKPPAKNLSGSKTAGAMGNPATPTMKGMPPTPSRTPMPVTPMPATVATPPTESVAPTGLNPILAAAVNRQPAAPPMPRTNQGKPKMFADPLNPNPQYGPGGAVTGSVPPTIAEALGTGSLNTSGQYAPGYGPQKGDHVRGKHSGVGKPNAEEIKQFYISQYGGNWQQAMQNQDAFSKAFAQEQAYVDAGRLTPDGKGGQLLDGKPYTEVNRDDMSTYAQFGAKPLDPNAGQVYSDGSPYPSTSSPDPRGNIGSNYGYGSNNTSQQRPFNPGQGPMAAQNQAALEAQYKAQDPNWHPGLVAPNVYAQNKAYMDYNNTVDPYSNWTMNSVGDLLKPEHSGTAPWDPAYQAWQKDPANAAAIAKSKAYAANPTPIDGYMSNYAGNGTYSFDKVPPAPSATGHKRGGLLSLINKR